MSKEIYISSTPHETRLAIVENDDLTEIYYERENEYTLAGSIYNGKVTRVLPGMQSSFVDIGLERDAFLYITDFMEEAGDSAEFDSADGSSGGRRNQRDGRNGGGSREETTAIREDANGDSNRLAAPAPEGRTERGDRDGGRRRRGNRDGRGSGGRENQGSAEDRGGSRDQPVAARSPSASASDPSVEATPVVHSGYLEPGADNSAELGEGAPGADGSRRWRGRRGRRRGRTSSQQEESQAIQQPSFAQDSPSPDSTTPPGRGYQADSSDAEEVEGNFDQEYDDSIDLEATAAPLPVPQAQVTDAQQPSQDVPRSRDERSSRDRGDRDRNRRDRGGRDRDSRAPRVPRGFAPSRALYGVDSAAEAEPYPADGPTPEPIILPGESLSKYRKADDQSASSGAATPLQSTVPVPRPSTEYALPGTWDGGSVLPGETLRPRTNTGSEGRSPDRSSPERFIAERSNSDRFSDSRGSRDRGARDGRRGRNDRFDGGRDARRDNRDRVSSETVPYPAAAQSDEQIRPLAAPASAPEPAAFAPSSTPFVPLAETSLQHFPGGVPEQATPEAIYSLSQRSHEPAEYEPTEGSASVRFDATTRSEFRQSAPPAEPFGGASSAIAEADEPQAEVHTPLQQPSDVHESAEHSIAHTITPQPETPIATLHSSEEISSAHEFTSIQNTGEMLSEASSPSQGEIAEPTSPLHHETAVLNTVVEPADSLETPSGLLEEELVDEEDFTATTLHASSIEEMDYEEEETLEGAADLGAMIREMSIDQITRPGEDPEEEDDILEEEDAVDDHLTLYEDTEEEDEPRSFEENSSPGAHDGEWQRSQVDQGYAADRSQSIESSSNGFETSRDPDRRSGRRDVGRRDGRRGDRSRDRGGDRARSTGGSGDRSTSRPGRRDGRHSAQTTNLPAISDLLKPGQEVLIQIAKEPIAKKGARITSHIALPGRFLVFMPTVNHTGVSRKIESDGERRRLKEILLSERGEASGGFIVRTAAANASEEELRSDLRFLLNLWADIKQRSESSKSPALIYHDLNLVERILRDQVTDTFSAIWVDTETEYERVLRFLQRFQPSLIRRVKLYTKETPLFEQFGITEEINKALRSKVWLKSGGSIVINQTEALVAIDINTGKYVGKTARLEDTIVKTNLDAIPEIVRQIRLRDLGGIIIIDFIDMDERKNRSRVMAALEDELKKDRAPSKVLQFNDFGLVAITRKRVKQSLERTLSSTCNVCQGTGMTKSPVTVCNDIYIEMRKMQKHLDRGDVMLRVNPDVVKQLKAPGTKWLQEMEDMVGKTILVKSDPTLHPEQFDIH